MGQATPPRSSCLKGGIAYTGRGARQVSVAALVSPRDPDPLWGSGTLHCTESLHTGWGATPHIPTTCRCPDLPAPLGPDTVPNWLGGPEPVSGNCPQSGAGRRGRYRGEGPTSGVTSTFDQVLLLWPLSPRPSSWTPYPGGCKSQGSLGAFLLPQPRLGPWSGEPMKPNKLVSCIPKCSLSHFLKIIQCPCLHAPKTMGR